MILSNKDNKMKKIKILIIAMLISSPMLGQQDENYSDKLLSRSFKAYNEVDFEFSYSMFPFIKKRFLQQLQDTASFVNSYDSLSKYVGIKYSSDSLVKTYSWEERHSGCCISSQTYVQFKTRTGDIKFLDLKELDVKGIESIYIVDLKMLTINTKPYYLILGWGTCCGGKHYSRATIYEIKNGYFCKSKSLFDGEAEIYTEANRSQKIEIKYAPEKKILSYNCYGDITETGFYGRKKSHIKWKLKKHGFKRIN